MKKKLLVLVAMLLCVVTVLASCASSMKFEKVVGDGTYNDENPALTTSAKLDVKGEYSAALSKDDLLVFVDFDTEKQLSTYTVYNLATGATVLTLADTNSKTDASENYTTVTYSLEVKEQWNTNWIKVTATTTTVTANAATGIPDVDTKKDLKYYTAAGAEFAAIADFDESDLSAAWVEEDLICLDGKVYRIADDGTVAHAFDWNELRALPDVEKVGNCYLGETNVEGSVSIYDASLNLVTTYVLPSYAMGDTEDFAVALSNGNLLVQYQVAADLMADEYTYLEDNQYGGAPTKVNLYSFLIDAEKGKVKELDLDFIVMAAYFEDENDEDWFYNEKVENIAYVFYIEDQRVNFTPAAQKLVSLSNKAQIKGVIEPVEGMITLSQVATNRWVATTISGHVFLLNEKGEVLGEVSKAMRATKTSDFFVLNDKVYDWDLNVKYDMDENKIKTFEVMAHGILMVNEDGETLLYANGAATTLVAKDVDDKEVLPLPINYAEEDYSKDVFVIVTETENGKKYEFCNSVGTVVLTLENVELDEDMYVCGADSNNAILIKGTTVATETEAAKTVYYRIG